MARTEADKKHESQYGGYREDAESKRYWLRPAEIKEFDKKNLDISDDAEFWAWFDKFRKDKKIYEAWANKTERGEVSWGFDDKKKKGSYLSEWWTGSYFSKGWGGMSSPEASKLALAMTAIRTVIRVIDDSDPPMTVKWAQTGVSYTDFKSGAIHINPEPIKNDKLAEGEAIDIATAFAMHEASHATYTAPIWEQVTKPEAINPLAVSGLMANLLEDIRIERKTSAKFPGFAEYFEKSLDYLWKSNATSPPKEYGPDLQSRVNFAICSVKWPIESEALWRKDESTELDWWQAWSARYQADESLPLRASCQEAIDHLRLATEKEKGEGKADAKGEGKAAGEMDKISESEEALRKAGIAGARLRREIERILRDFGIAVVEFCPHPDPEDGLEDSEATEVERLVTEQLRRDEIPVKMPNGATFASVFVSKPTEDDRSRSAYIGKPSPMLARLKASLLFRQELPQYTNRLQKEGGLDDEELWRWSAGDYRVFEEKVIAVHPKVQMGLLVDMSGSMCGEHLETAQELAQLFCWALRDMSNVTTKIFGHTANVTGSRDCQVYRLWEPGDPMNRLGLISTLPHMNNYDGFAIASVVKDLMERGEPDEQRVLIVLADGYPQGTGYGGSEGMKHVKMVDDWARRNGVEVIQIAIDYSLNAERQSAMFKRWIPYEKDMSLPSKLEALLAKLT